MKWLFSALAAFGFLMPQAAFAADSSAGADSQWTGLYLGAQFGGSWGTDSVSETTTKVPPLTGYGHLRSRRFMGGGHAGYNWQLDDFVVGVESDIEGASGSDDASSCLIQSAGAGNTTPGACFPQTLVGYSYSAQVQWQGSLRARVGYTLENTLLYATGGLAFAGIHTNYQQVALSQSFDQIQPGYTVGGGLEYAVDDNWHVGLEYRYSGFDTISNPITSAGIFWNGYTDFHDIQEHNVRAAVSYYFR